MFYYYFKTKKNEKKSIIYYGSFHSVVSILADNILCI